jgi:hypothetical protein
MGTIHKTAASGDFSITGGTATVSVDRSLAMTRDANDLMAGLAQETGLGEGDVLRLALGMFKVAVDAKKEGKHVGVARSPEALDLELTGF